VSHEEAADRELRIRILNDKAQALGSQATGLLPTAQDVVGLSVVVGIAAVSVGLTQNHPGFLVLLPFPVILLAVMVLQRGTELLSRTGHKRFLEEEVNQLADRALLVEETHVAPASLHGATSLGRPSVTMLVLAFLLLLGLTVGVALNHLDHVTGLGWNALFAAALVGGLAMIGAAFRENRAAYTAAYAAARDGYHGAPPIATSLIRDEP
jgi:FtsH-binding integral membrane protein